MVVFHQYHLNEGVASVSFTKDIQLEVVVDSVSDILNNQGVISGNQQAGIVYVKTAGRGIYGYQTYTPKDVVFSAVDDIDSIYDERFDDPRYYMGDNNG